MLKKLKTAFDKFRFCLRSSGTSRDLLRLLLNTKKYANAGRNKRNSASVSYLLKLEGQPRQVFLRTYSGDIEMLYEIFWRKTYHSSSVRWQDFNTIIDLGANIGMASLFFAAKSPRATIYAVEPDPENFELLTANLSQEISASRLVPVQSAITAGNGMIHLIRNEKAYNSFVSEEIVSGITVRTRDMEGFLRDMFIDDVDLLKIDIEGREADLFSGDTGWLQKVRNIVMECHSEEIRNKAVSVLQEYGFSVHSRNNDRSYADILWACRF